MKNNPKLLEKLIEKIKNTPDNIIESAINKLCETMELENCTYDASVLNNFSLESESNKWKENLSIAA